MQGKAGTPQQLNTNHFGSLFLSGFVANHLGYFSTTTTTTSCDTESK
jgi:hypothetical protein